MGLGLVELCARNLSAAIRETLNAQIAAKQSVVAAKEIEGHPSVPESVVKNIHEARLLLEIAKQELDNKVK